MSVLHRLVCTLNPDRPNGGRLGVLSRKMELYERDPHITKLSCGSLCRLLLGSLDFKLHDFSHTNITSVYSEVYGCCVIKFIFSLILDSMQNNVLDNQFYLKKVETFCIQSKYKLPYGLSYPLKRSLDEWLGQLIYQNRILKSQGFTEKIYVF